jgi:hypothetical protein
MSVQKTEGIDQRADHSVMFLSFISFAMPAYQSSLPAKEDNGHNPNGKQ